MTIYTIGHSVLQIEDFVSLLTHHQIETLADVRSYPGSKRMPWFNKENLESFLDKAGINYIHIPKLGGRRKVSPDSQNTRWRHPAFRGYADHMETEEFAQGITELLQTASKQNTAIMCAEALWWKCHRSLISDYLKAAGHTVLHIFSKSEVKEHPYTKAANIVDGKLSYREETLF